MIASCDRDPMCRRNANAGRSADFFAGRRFPKKRRPSANSVQIKMRPASYGNAETGNDLAMLRTVDIEKLFDA